MISRQLVLEEALRHTHSLVRLTAFREAQEEIFDFVKRRSEQASNSFKWRLARCYRV